MTKFSLLPVLNKEKLHELRIPDTGLCIVTNKCGLLKIPKSLSGSVKFESNCGQLPFKRFACKHWNDISKCKGEMLGNLPHAPDHFNF